jgi:apolipoprotein N-acyltransferase
MTTNVDGPTTGYVLLPQAHVEPSSPDADRMTRTVLPAVMTGAFLWMCYFPVAWGWLGWAALVPLLVLVRAAASPSRIYLSAWLAGSLFFWPVLQWMRVADERMYYTWAALAIYCSLYFPLAVGLLRLLDRRTRLPLVVTLPVVWTALEYLRAHLMTGFPWYFLGHTQHDFLAVIQIADLGGAYAVTFLVAAVNAILFEALYRVEGFRKLFALPPCVAGWRSLAGQAVFACVLLTAALVYGAVQLRESQFRQGPLVALIQSNLDQRIKMMGTDEAFRRMFEHNRDLSNYACSQDEKPELIVWPETSLPGEWHASVSDNNVIQKAEAREVQSLIVDRWKTNVLLGVTSRVREADGKERSYNSAVLVRPNGESAGRYDKMHRVPFGEYVPLQGWFPWMAQFAPYDYDYGVEAGKSATHFKLDPHNNFGVVICYEDTDPVLAREYHCPWFHLGADFLLNISNDGWFDGSAEHEQHLAICRFRAVECRLAVARAVNMGISTVVDSNGRVLRPERGYLVRQDYSFQAWNWKGLPETIPAGGELPVQRWSDFKKAAGVMLTHIPIDDRTSLYAHFGDWLPRGCWLFLGLGLVVSWFRPRSGER